MVNKYNKTAIFKALKKVADFTQQPLLTVSADNRSKTLPIIYSRFSSMVALLVALYISPNEKRHQLSLLAPLLY